jgi:hypothetical protein
MDLLEERQPDTSHIVGMLYSHIMLAMLDKPRQYPARKHRFWDVHSQASGPE